MTQPPSAANNPLETTAGPGWTAAVGEPTTVVLVRHGQTSLSVERRYSGRGDAALTEIGQRQAAQSVERLALLEDVHAVVASPLQRCLGTATPLADRLGVNLHVEDRIVETDFGQWEGLTFNDARERDPEIHSRWLRDTSVVPPGGESFDAVRTRVLAGLAEHTARVAGGTLVVVSHVTPIKLALQDALGVGSELLYRLHLDLASVSVLRHYPDGNSSVHLVNDTSHLHA